MFRFLIVAASFLGFCYYAFTTVEQSDGARYRTEIGQLREQVVTLMQERNSITAERDTIKEKLEQAEAADSESTDGTPASRPAEG